MNNMVANALFADGAAAMIVQQRAPYLSRCLRMDGFYCELVPQTNQDMAWHITNFGFEMVLSSYVPRAIEAGIAALIIKLREHAMMPLHAIDYYAIHPGGVKILQACEQALGLTALDNRFSYEVLRQHGNMSSATVLFVLRAIWNDLSAPDSQKSILSCAFGPGLTLESALLTVH
jgi:predicted naringenin-chalcone synthase